MRAPGVTIEPWGPGDLPLLTKILGDPAMTEHLGGPESDDALAARQGRYERLPASGAGRMFKIVDLATGEGAGSVGYWEKEWRGGTVWETGWSVLPEFQGRGIASAATELALDAARADAKHRYVHAFPSVDNHPSNAICRKLGFELVEEALGFEYPPGNPLRCNDWRFDLWPRGGA
ncbi:MAG TPA: GNAT family N-acetyltransferase [Actinomycetota bacterium]|nr:GNAT family N-acetyltransferase [Actinomycetota bacterium]